MDSTRPPLFDDSDINAPVNSWDVETKLARIREIERQQADLDLLEEQKNDWFRQKRFALAQRLDLLMGQVKDFLVVNKLKNIKLPSGTPYLTNTTSYIWPEDKALLDWAKLNQRDGETLYRAKTTESPDKKAIKAHIKSTGNRPDGLRIEDIVSLGIRESQPGDTFMEATPAETTQKESSGW